MINQSWLWRCFPSFFSLPHFPFCLLRTRSAKLHRGPVRKPEERKIGPKRPKITHLPKSAETRTRRERQAEKQAVAAERRAVKKAARQHLKQQLHVGAEEN